MLYRAFSVSALALVMATSSLSIANADITATSKDVNLKLKAMAGLFDGNQVLMIHASGEQDIIDAVESTKKLGVSKFE